MKYGISIVLALLIPLVWSQRPGIGFAPNSNRRIQQGGTPTRNSVSSNSQATRLGLLAHQIGVAPVPGGNFQNFGQNPSFGGGGSSGFGNNPNSNFGGGSSSGFGNNQNFAGGNFGSFRPNAPLQQGGGNTNEFHNGAPRGCFCIPKNQVCNPSGAIPPRSVRINKIDTRIINTNARSACPQEQQQCCFGTAGGSTGNGGPGSTGGQSGALKGCGATTNLHAVRVKGSETQFGEYPWMTAILKNRADFVSGGFIASPDTIVTAAHKVTEPILYKVRVGDWDLSIPNEVPQYPHQEIQVAQVIYHPQFNPTTLQNDVAILKLQRPIRFSDHINAVCLPERRQRFGGNRCYLSGWGTNEHKQFQPILREVDLPIVDEFECENRLQRTRLGQSFKLDKQSFVCAGGEKGKDACAGDGGSPLVCQEGPRWTVVGLVAWGIGCAEQDIPGVYVNIAAFSDFINQYI